MKRFTRLVTVALLAIAAARAGSPLVIAFVPKGSTHEYWKTMQAGAIRAAKELNDSGTPITLIWKGPLREDDRDMQVQVVENFIGQRVDGIVLAPLDSRALQRPVEEAVASGIPVVTVDTPLNSPVGSALIATNNRDAGKAAARTLGGLLHGRGNIILLRVDISSISTVEREEGFLAELQSEFPHIVILSSNEHAGVSRDKARSVSENLLNQFGDKVNGVFASNESSASGMLLALEDAGLAGGKVKFVAFDAGQALLKGLSAGDVQAIVVQDPEKMGYLGVKTMAAILNHKPYEKLSDTGILIIDHAK